MKQLQKGIFPYCVRIWLLFTAFIGGMIVVRRLMLELGVVCAGIWGEEAIGVAVLNGFAEGFSVYSDTLEWMVTLFSVAMSMELAGKMWNIHFQFGRMRKNFFGESLLLLGGLTLCQVILYLVLSGVHGLLLGHRDRLFGDGSMPVTISPWIAAVAIGVLIFGLLCFSYQYTLRNPTTKKILMAVVSYGSAYGATILSMLMIEYDWAIWASIAVGIVFGILGVVGLYRLCPTLGMESMQEQQKEAVV